jgi:hypothetical protein
MMEGGEKEVFFQVCKGIFPPSNPSFNKLRMKIFKKRLEG